MVATGTQGSVGRVRSADGTEIGYRSVGHGPGLVVVHGALETAAHYTDLATALGARFAVHVPDRRGRGASGPHRAGHGLATEIADVRAVLDATGARMLFGVSSGGVIALQAGLALPGVARVAVHEPALTVPGRSTARSDALVRRYERAVDRGRTGEAMVAVLRLTGMGPGWLRRLPGPVAAALLQRFLAGEDAEAEPGTPTPLAALVPTMRHDFRISGEGDAGWPRYGELRCPVLLLGGDRSPRFLTDALDELARRMPTARRVTLAGAGHTAAGNREDGGRPDLVARELLGFLSGEGPGRTG